MLHMSTPLQSTSEHSPVSNEPTPASQIERWQQLKVHRTAQSKAFADYCKPFKD